MGDILRRKMVWGLTLFLTRFEDLDQPHVGAVLRSNANGGMIVHFLHARTHQVGARPLGPPALARFQPCRGKLPIWDQ